MFNQNYEYNFFILKKKLPNPELQIPIDDKIHLNKTVIRIEWSSDEKTANKVVCEDGSEYSGDHIIITVSLGVLKEKYIIYLCRKCHHFAVDTY